MTGRICPVAVGRSAACGVGIGHHEIGLGVGLDRIVGMLHLNVRHLNSRLRLGRLRPVGSARFQVVELQIVLVQVVELELRVGVQIVVVRRIRGLGNRRDDHHSLGQHRANDHRFGCGKVSCGKVSHRHFGHGHAGDRLSENGLSGDSVRSGLGHGRLGLLVDEIGDVRLDAGRFQCFQSRRIDRHGRHLAGPAFRQVVDRSGRGLFVTAHDARQVVQNVLLDDAAALS